MPIYARSRLQTLHFNQRQAEWHGFSQFLNRRTKSQDNTLMSPWQNPNECIPSLRRLSCLCQLRLPRKTVVLSPSSHHIRMNSLFSSITVSVTQSAVTSRLKLIQKQSPINCVQRQFEVLFPFRKTGISCPNYIIFFCNWYRCSELLHLLKHSNTSQLVELWMSHLISFSSKGHYWKIGIPRLNNHVTNANYDNCSSESVLCFLHWFLKQYTTYYRIKGEKQLN